MKEELKNTIIELGVLVKGLGLEISDFELMDLSLRLYNTEQINKSKDYPRQFNFFQKKSRKRTIY